MCLYRCSCISLRAHGFLNSHYYVSLFVFFLGMHAGLPKYVPVNLKDIEAAGFLEGDEVSLETLKKKGLINPSGRERKLPLKVQIMTFPTMIYFYLYSYNILLDFLSVKKEKQCDMLHLGLSSDKIGIF